MLRRGFSYGGGGGGGTPGGLDTYVQYNAAGAFAGDAGFTYNATNKTLNIGGGTVTVSNPVLNLSQTWNDAGVTFTGVKLNVTSTASAAASLLADFQVGGVSVATLSKTGALFLEQGATDTALDGGVLTLGDFKISGANSTPSYYGLRIGAINFAAFSNSTSTYGYTSGPTYPIGWFSGTVQYNQPADVLLYRDAAATLALRNGTNAQTFRVYDTYTDASNYARLALNTGKTGDWVQVAAEGAGTGSANWSIALSPAGTGAISAQVPDSGTGGGNARGPYSTDWQRVRSNAVMAAIGSYDVIGGGRDNQTGAGASYQTVAGGYSNSAAGDYSTIAGGDRNDAVGKSFIGGGQQNTASGDTSTVVCGLFNIASGTLSFVGCGYNNHVAGNSGWIPGGRDATQRGLFGAYAYSAGMRAAQGDAQIIGQPVRVTTSAVSAVILTTDGAAESTTNCMVLPVNSGGQFEGKLTAVHAAGAAVGGWKVEGSARRGAAGAATVVGLVVTALGTIDAAIGAPIITVAALAGAGIGAIAFQVTPANATTTYWVGKLEVIQAA